MDDDGFPVWKMRIIVWKTFQTLFSGYKLQHAANSIQTRRIYVTIAIWVVRNKTDALMQEQQVHQNRRAKNDESIHGENGTDAAASCLGDRYTSGAGSVLSSGEIFHG